MGLDGDGIARYLYPPFVGFYFWPKQGFFIFFGGLAEGSAGERGMIFLR